MDYLYKEIKKINVYHLFHFIVRWNFCEKKSYLISTGMMMT